MKEYTYYHCTRRREDYDCSQKKSITLDDLEEKIEKEIEKYTILPEFLQWALEGLNKKNDHEIEERTNIYEMQHKTLAQTQKELDELTKMRYRQLIDDETFLKDKNELTAKIAQMKNKLRETEVRAERWLELTERTFNFATYARAAFLKATEIGKAGLELKKEILLALGQSPKIKDGQLVIEPNEWFVPIQKGYPALEKKYLALEPTKLPLNKARTEALASVRAHWRSVVDSIRTYWMTTKELIVIPNYA